MADMVVYADNAATTQLSAAAAMRMVTAGTVNYGNPSSAHGEGKAAREMLEQARETIARCINAEPDEIFFTSGGTESNAWAVMMGGIHSRFGYASAVEHHSMTKPMGIAFHFLKKIPVDEDGAVDTRDIEISAWSGAFASVMAANNEIGTIQPVEKLAAVCRRNGILFHTDAVQAVGHIPVDVKELGVDMLSASAHKFHGPKGVGFLYVRKGVVMYPFHQGGGQERGMRSGTENVPGIAGMAVALEEAVENMAANTERVTAMRDHLIDGLLEIPGTRLNGGKKNRLPGNVNVSFDAVDGNSLVLLLSQYGIAVSAGSACTTGDPEPSHVLLAIGCAEEQARGSIRISIDEYNNEKEIDYILQSIPECVSYLRKARE